ncbi:hypothetical protein MBLNU457_1684t1 [Dothideomycetes sp. NU457]
MSEPHRVENGTSKKAEEAGIMPSHHGISLDITSPEADVRPPAVTHVSTPAYHSPLRHHRRASSRTKHVKETLNAHSHYGSSSDDGTATFQVNQYNIKQEIGRGSFGSVHLAVDQFGTEFAIKEFSKSRLRKRAQSNLLRRPRRTPSSHLTAESGGFNSPLSRVTSEDRAKGSTNNSLELIKEEIAIMKKLNHNNLVNLIEVLDDPEEDSLYMVLEMCKKGVVMKVGLEETADPYDDETCRCWFRDMILGIEYLHAQGIIHRDLKPDNCLITDDDVLKIVDFGVSEMFEKDSEMHTSKSAGSPAFMPPELCVAKHGQVSGKAADIWSMGVTLYCLKFGKIPFEKGSMLELYDSIRADEFDLPGKQDPNLVDLMRQILEKNPEKRITMKQLREHPWVTKNGEDPLLSEQENCADIVEPPTEEEKEQAITGNVSNLMIVMKAVRRFKQLLMRKRPEMMEGIFGRASRIVAPPSLLGRAYPSRKSKSQDTHDRKPVEQALIAEGIHHPLVVNDDNEVSPRCFEQARQSENSLLQDHSIEQQTTEGRLSQRKETETHHLSARQRTSSRDSLSRGHAHDPLKDTLWLNIGAGTDPVTDPETCISESPTGTEDGIYEMAYRQEMDKILERRGRAATMFLNRRVEHRSDIKKHDNIIDHARAATMSAFGAGSSDSTGGGLAGLVQKAKAAAHKEGDSNENDTEDDQKESEETPKHESGGGIAGLVHKAKAAARHEGNPNEKEDVGENDQKQPDKAAMSKEDGP